ncbi:MAG: hypothetical protein GXO23_06020 [Crenarchaeota archaeon]|nr:hypothetical protein [Thermoproteota archaeon]
MDICCLYAGSANLTDSGLESNIEVFYAPSQCDCIGLINELHKVYRESLYDNASIDELRDRLEEVIKLLERLLSKGDGTLPDGGLGDEDFWYFYDLWKASHSVEESLVRLVRIVSCHCFKNIPREILHFLDLLSTLWKIVHKLSNISLQAKHVALSKLIYSSESKSITKCLVKYRRRVSYLVRNISSFLDKLYYYRNRIDIIFGLLKNSVDSENERRFREWLDEFLDVSKG